MTPHDDQVDPAEFARRMANYERISSALWVVLGLIQLFVALKLPFFGWFGAIAGVWNLWASVTRWRAAKVIQSRGPGVPAAFKPLSPYILIGLVNVLVGGMVGVAFVALDLYVRHQILTHAWVFDAPVPVAAVTQG